MADTIQYKPITGLNETSLNKIIEISGKELAEKSYVDAAVSNITIDTTNFATKSELETKVNKEEGKGLSTEDFTTEYKNKLEGLNNAGVTDEQISTAINNYMQENPISSGLVNQNGGGALKIWAGTKAQYDALLIKDEDTVYLVEGSSGSSDVANTYSITNNLTNCASNNSSISVNENSSYSATITANSGYDLSTVSVTMGGNDITSSVYSSGTISIASVTGDIVITATATASSTVTTLTYKVGKTCDASGVISDDSKKILIEDIPISGTTTINVTFKDGTDAFFVARCFNEDGALGNAEPAKLANDSYKPINIRELLSGTTYVKLVMAENDKASIVVTEDYIKDKILVVNNVEYTLVKGE